MLRPQPRLEVLDKALDEGHKVLALPDAAGDGLLQHVVWQHWVGQYGLVLPPLLRVPQPRHQLVVLAPQPIRVCVLQRLDLRLKDLDLELCFG